MKILAVEKECPGIGASAFEPHLKSEAFKVWELYQADIVREMYFRLDKSEAVLILECAGIEEAQEILNSLPLVSEGLITFEIIPLKRIGLFSFSSQNDLKFNYSESQSLQIERDDRDIPCNDFLSSAR